MTTTTKITKTEHDEYRVRLFIDGVHQAGADYFATDRDEAKATAKLMEERACQSDKITDFAKAEAEDFADEQPDAALASAWAALNTANDAVKRAVRSGKIEKVKSAHKAALVAYRAFWALPGADEFAANT